MAPPPLNLQDNNIHFSFVKDDAWKYFLERTPASNEAVNVFGEVPNKQTKPLYLMAVLKMLIILEKLYLCHIKSKD